MAKTQVSPNPATRIDLFSERLGPLPLINHFVQRMRLEEFFERHVPTTDRRCLVPHAQALLVLLRSIVVEREPIYRQYETALGFANGLFGIGPDAMAHLSDDRIGRALDHLFEADRAALLTDVVVSLARKFELRFDRIHNDSTSISFCGQYRAASGKRVRGKMAPAITYGFSKDHRPDLKQLLFILSVEADGGLPIHFRVANGNTNDSITHIESWTALCAITGRKDFLYVADSKLCSWANMDYIQRAGGRFVTVMPRSRAEDAEFRAWIQTNNPPWEPIWDRPNPRYKDGPRDQWHAWRAPLLSAEACQIVWVWSTLLTLRQRSRRRRNIATAVEKLTELRARLTSAKARLRGAAQIDHEVAEILEHYHVVRYLKVKRIVCETHTFKQTRRGRPGPDTAYTKVTKRRCDIEWAQDDAAIEYDQNSDGMYPLISNDRTLTPAQVLEAHKGQPKIEKRFEQLKTVHEIAPVYLKNEARIEALFTLYFLALLVQAVIERELRVAMQREKIPELPLYPEQRLCKRPTTEQVLRLFSLAERHTLMSEGQIVRVFHPQLTPLQCQVLDLLGVRRGAYQPSQ